VFSSLKNKKEINANGKLVEIGLMDEKEDETILPHTSYENNLKRMLSKLLLIKCPSRNF
jgi:hypothetical protein